MNKEFNINETTIEEILLRIWNKKKMVLTITLFGFILSAIYENFSNKIYELEAILSVGTIQKTAAILSVGTIQKTKIQPIPEIIYKINSGLYHSNEFNKVCKSKFGSTKAIEMNNYIVINLKNNDKKKIYECMNDIENLVKKDDLSFIEEEEKLRATQLDNYNHELEKLKTHENKLNNVAKNLNPNNLMLNSYFQQLNYIKQIDINEKKIKLEALEKSYPSKIINYSDIKQNPPSKFIINAGTLIFFVLGMLLSLINFK